MFQFTPYPTYYADCTSPSNLYSINLMPDVNFQSPAEIYQNCILQNAQNFNIFPLQSNNNEKEESNHSSHHTSVQEKSLIQEKKQRSNENMGIKQQANKQKFGRNILSNIFHLMIKFIKRQKKLKKLIEKLILTNGMIIKMNEFYQILKRKSCKLRAYATLQQIKDFWSGNSKEQTLNNFIKQRECSKIFRILGMLYLEKHHIPYVYNSNKIKKQSKSLHNNAIRKIKALF